MPETTWLVHNWDDSENNGDMANLVDRNVEIGVCVGEAIDKINSGQIHVGEILVDCRIGDDVIRTFKVTVTEDVLIEIADVWAYDVISCTILGDLIKFVNNRIIDNWQPAGGIQVMVNSDNRMHYYQAIKRLGEQ